MAAQTDVDWKHGLKLLLRACPDSREDKEEMVKALINLKGEGAANALNVLAKRFDFDNGKKQLVSPASDMSRCRSSGRRWNIAKASDLIGLRCMSACPSQLIARGGSS